MLNQSFRSTLVCAVCLSSRFPRHRSAALAAASLRLLTTVLIVHPSISSLFAKSSSRSSFASASSNNSASAAAFCASPFEQLERRCFTSATSNKMSVSSSVASYFRVWETGKTEAIQKAILPMKHDAHKGSSGRIAVLGGSDRYTGAPYYAAMAALRVGADLSTVFTAAEAATPLKCYSPELMVQPVYSAADFDRIASGQAKPAQAQAWMRAMVEAVTQSLDRVHCLVVGPGMGRCPAVMQAVARIIAQARQQNVYMVLDADALFLLSQPEYRNLLRGYDKAVLTPNVMEYKRLYEGLLDDDDPFESVTIVKKGHEDLIRVNDTTLLTCAEVGGFKRAGGIGDVLSGTLGTLVAWHKILVEGNFETTATTVDLPLSCWTACCVVKRATRRAFQSKRRSMSATDVLDELGATLDQMESVWV